MILQGRLLIDPTGEPPPGWIAVDGGRIAEIGEGSPPERPRAGGPEALLCPAFTDAHLHLPQFEAIGCDGLDLLGWLEAEIFPAEARWADATAAASQLAGAYRSMLRAGTLAYAGFLTSHAHGLELVRRQHGMLPLHALVGQSLMDRRGPPQLVETATAPLPAPEPRLRYSVNPRFAVTSSERQLEEAGRLAGAGHFVQTHLAEQTREVQLVASLFPDAPSYTAVYDRFGLLTRRTLLAHGVHLAPEEWALIARRGSVVVHCPTANTFLSSGLFDLGAAREHGVRVALGSDVAAGPDVAMPRVARAMIEVAKLRRVAGLGAGPVPSPEEAWAMITEQNADAIEAPGGRLAVDAAADLLILRPPPIVDRHLIGRLIYTWRDEYITHRVVAGRLVGDDG